MTAQLRLPFVFPFPPSVFFKTPRLRAARIHAANTPCVAPSRRIAPVGRDKIGIVQAQAIHLIQSRQPTSMDSIVQQLAQLLTGLDNTNAAGQTPEQMANGLLEHVRRVAHGG